MHFALLVILRLSIVEGGLVWGNEKQYEAFCTCNKTSKDTRGSCHLQSCDIDRYAECVNGDCVCPDGYCSCEHKGNNLCRMTDDKLKAVVYPTEFPPKQRGKIAIAFSGGGSRAGSLTRGVLRALERLQLMDKIEGMSAVSGGSWATGIYMYSGEDWTTLLGRCAIREGTESELESFTGETDLGKRFTKDVLTTFMKTAIKWEELNNVWVDAVRTVMLTEYNKSSYHAYTARSESSAKKILLANPGLAGVPVYVQRRDMTYLIGTSLLSEANTTWGGDPIKMLQIGGDFSGSPTDGWVESFAFGGDGPRPESWDSNLNGEQVELASPMQPVGLPRAIGWSSWDLGKLMAKHNGAGSVMNPLFDYWGHAGAPVRYFMGDGSATENTGVLMMVQRGFSKIISVLSTDTCLYMPKGTLRDTCQQPNAGDDESVDCEKCAMEEYQTFGKENCKRSTCYNDEQKHYRSMTTNNLWQFFEDVTGDDAVRSRNTIFAKEEFAKTVCELRKLEMQHKTLVLKRKYILQSNAHWGIQQGGEVEMLWVYNSYSRKLLDHFTPEAREALGDKDKFGVKPNFPYFPTTTATKNTNLDPVKVNAMSALGEFMILDNRDVVRQMLSPGSKDVDVDKDCADVDEASDHRLSKFLLAQILIWPVILLSS